jgi:hypothetical protein
MDAACVAVYLDTIALLDQPAATRSDASDTPIRSARKAQPLLHAWADGISKRCRRSLMAFEDI